MKVRFFRWIALWLLLATAARAQSPLDATDRDLIPTLFAEPAADGSLDVAWRSTDGRLMLSTFSGADFSLGRQVQLATNLNLLGGLARDEAGNRYIAAFRRESADAGAWAAGFRPGVAHILKIAPGSDQTTVLADVNQNQFIQNGRPIINPLAMAKNEVINSEMVYANGMLTLGFGHNHGAFNQIQRTGALIGIGTDGSAKYAGGGEQQTGQIRLGLDGSNILMAQTVQEGLGLSILRPAGNTYAWSNFVLSHEVDPFQYIYIGGIVSTPSSHLVIFSQGDAAGASGEQGVFGKSALKVLHVDREFDKLPVDFRNNMRVAQRKHAVTTIAESLQGKSYLRPIVMPVSQGRSIIVYEQWSNANGAEGVLATMLDSTGNPIHQSQFLSGLKIQKSTRAFFLPTLRRVGWVNGENGKLKLHTLDANLTLVSFELGRGGSVPTPTPPQPPFPTPTPTPPQPQSLAGTYLNSDGTTAYTLELSNGALTFVDTAGNRFLLETNPDRANSFRFKDHPTYTVTGLGNDTVEYANPFRKSTAKRQAGGTIPPGPMARLTAAAIVGRYVRDNPENDYHEGRIEILSAVPGQPAVFRWTNKANVSWKLTENSATSELTTGPDSPYFDDAVHGRAFKLTQRKNPDGTLRPEVEGFTYMQEFYRRMN